MVSSGALVARDRLVLCLLGLGVGAFGTLIGAGDGFILTPTLLLLYPHGSRLRLALVHAAPFGSSPIAHIAEG